MIRTLLKPLSFIPALLMMYLIYSFSAQPAAQSSQVSYQVSYTIVKTADHLLDADLEEWQIEDYAVRYHNVTRKIAHMCEYFLLAVAVAFPFYVYGLHGILLMLLVGLICVGYACGDEYHQAFVAGRGPSVKDVAIDAFGAFWGIVLVRIIGWTGRHTIFRPKKKQERPVSRKEMKRLQAQQRAMELEQQSQAEALSRAQRRQAQREADLERMQRERVLARMRRQEQERFLEGEEIRPPEPQPGPEEFEPSSDQLCEDMPFARFFR